MYVKYQNRLHILYDIHYIHYISHTILYMILKLFIHYTYILQYVPYNVCIIYVHCTMYIVYINVCRTLYVL